MDDIFAEPKPDGFQTESPTRAFSDWTVAGIYAIGKGFRPSVQHLAPYLDALERKAGWRLVQILYPDSGERRTFIFRQAYYPVSPVTEYNIPFRGLEPEQSLADLAAPAKPSGPVADVAAALGSITAEDIARYDELPVNPAVEEFAKGDPINPKHYGGTACAEIGELLTPNAYQTLKCCWRLGEKDDPVAELGKAIWYWKREIALRADQTLPVTPGSDDFVEQRVKGRSHFTKRIALMLWKGYRLGMRPEHCRRILDALEEELSRRSFEDEPSEDPRGRSMEP